MARPANANAQATRKRILDSAATLFATLGEGQASMRHIAREAGVSQASVHHYFHSKADLHRACIDAMYARLHGVRASLVADMTRPMDMPERIRQMVGVMYRFGRENVDAVRLVQRSVLDRGEHAHPEREAMLFDTLGRLAAILDMHSPHGAEEIRQTLYAFNLLMIRMVLVDGAEIERIYGDEETAIGHLAGLLIGWLSMTSEPG
jgi:AcrR family transcriptional regulator